MTRYFQREIQKLKKRLLHLAATVEESLKTAIRAVTERDTTLAGEVVNRDNEIDQMEVELEEDCLKTLALHQPVAIDLRFLVAVLKINSDLERIGDLAVNIAKRTHQLARTSNTDIPFDLPGMLQLAIEMVKRAVDALIEMDAKSAGQVCCDDDDLDDRHRAAYSAVEQRIVERPEEAGYYITLLGISRNLERIGDHATNIAEDVIYMVDGEIVRHRGKDLNP